MANQARSSLPRKPAAKMSYLELIHIETKSFRKFIKEVLEEYGSKIIFRIDGLKYTIEDYNWLVFTWSNKKPLKKTNNFSAFLEGDEVFGFHDSPDNLWADRSQLQFVLKLSEMNIIKYEYADYPRPNNFIQKFIWYFKPPKPIRRYRG